MGTIKDRNGRDLVDAEKIKKIWKEYTEELSKKDLNVLDYCDGVVTTHSQTFWSVKLRGSWEALLSIKLMDVMEFQ